MDVVVIVISIIVLVLVIDIIALLLLFKAHLHQRKEGKERERGINEEGRNKISLFFQIDFLTLKKCFQFVLTSNTSFHFFRSKTIFLKQL